MNLLAASIMSRSKTTREPELPFTPKSTSRLRPGQFWSVPRSDGLFGCGRVISLRYRDNGKLDSRFFLAGLMDWVGHSPPTSESIAGHRTFRHGEAHIAAITESGGEIIGHRSLDLDGIEPDLFLSQSPGMGCMLQKGLDMLRPATEDEQSRLRIFSTWGCMVIQILANYLPDRVR